MERDRGMKNIEQGARAILFPGSSALILSGYLSPMMLLIGGYCLPSDVNGDVKNGFHQTETKEWPACTC